MDCIFCAIMAGDIPSDRVYEDDSVVAFKDINPKAPVHVLIVPRRHIPSFNDIAEEDVGLIGHIFLAARDIAKDMGVAESGYRLVSNNGPEGGQEVDHLHVHLLGGRQMRALG